MATLLSMLVPFEEIAAWSVEELKAEILALAPTGWLLIESFVDGYHLVKLDRPDQQTTITEHEEASPDHRLALYNLYGWLWTSSAPKPSENSPWNRRQELNREFVTKSVSVGGSRIPDPEDLDPVEVGHIHSRR